MDEQTMQNAAQGAEENIESTEPVETTDGQVAPGEGQEPQTQPNTEPQTTPSDQTATFDPIAELDKLQNLDPTLKDELKKGYLRQSDYTKKTQAISEDKKTLEEYRQMKPYLDRILQDEALSRFVFGQGQELVPQEQSPYPEDPIEYAKWIQNNTIQAMRQQMAEERDYESAASLDPRLKSDGEFAKVIAGYVAQDLDFLNGNKTAVQATQDALTAHEAYLAKMKSSFTSDLNKKVKEKTLVMPSGTSSPVGAAPNDAPQTMREAAKLAEDQLK